MDKIEKKDKDHSQLDFVFEESHYFRFLYQKTEKIVSAVHLITNLIKDEDAIKWQLRKRSVELLSDILTLYHLNLSDKKDIKKTKGLIVELVSLFEVACMAKIVSEMNTAILHRELRLLLDTIEGQIVGSSGYEKDDAQTLLFSDEFFSVSYGQATAMESPESPRSSASSNKDKGHYKGHSNQDRDDVNKMSFIKLRGALTDQTRGLDHSVLYNSKKVKSQNNTNSFENRFNEVKKDQNRKTIILDVLKKTKDISVQDLVGVIKDCSEKTIQRELLAMVKSGVLEKHGERRWSRYTLA